MSFLRSLFGGIKAMFERDRQGRELDEELRSYLDAAAEDRMRTGLTYEEALRAVRAEMGSTEAVKDEVRSSGWESALESFGQDVRYGLRQLCGTPGFTAVAVLTVALGIGANSAIFSLVHSVILKQLTVEDPSQLYRIGDGEYYCCEWGGLQDSWGTFAYPFYVHLRDTNPSFENIAAFSGNAPSFNVRSTRSGTEAQSISGEYVSGNYFETFGLHAAAGRLLTPADDRPDAPPVAVLGYRAWELRYGSDPSLIGSVLRINGQPFTLIGVAPRDYRGARLSSAPPELWIPLNQEPVFQEQKQNLMLTSGGVAWLYLIGRMKPGVNPASVQSQLSTTLQQWLVAEGRRDDDSHKMAAQQIRLTPGGTGVSSFRSNSRQGLLLLWVAAAVVLLIACANLANLLLARGSARRQQTALRLSLGATRFRLIRAALTESLILALAGGVVGLLFAYAGTKAILSIAFRGAIFVPVDPTPSTAVFAFALLLSVLTGIAFGVLPAWTATKPRLADGLRVQSRTSTLHSTGPQRTLVVVQVALSVVLLAVAGLAAQSLQNLQTADTGFVAEGRLLATVGLKAAGYKPEQLPALYAQIQNDLEKIPGVRSASLSLNVPQGYCCINLNVAIEGKSDRSIENINVLFNRVSPHYFATIGTPVLRGRAILEEDTADSRHVAVVDEAFAKIFFPGEEALGRHFGLSLEGHGSDYEIVGIVANSLYRSPQSEQSPVFFLPFTQTTHFDESGYRRLETGTLYAQSIQVHVSGDPENYAGTLRGVLNRVNPSLAVINTKTYTELIAVQFNQQRLLARLTALFSTLALLLASLGLYAVTAYNVARRTSEIGIRMALGAQRSLVMAMVLRGALVQVLIGLCFGIPLALLCGRYLTHLLYRVGPSDPLILGGAIFVLAGCTAVASMLPAHRAASIEPVEALRVE